MIPDSGNGVKSCDAGKLLVVDDDTAVRRSIVRILAYYFPEYEIDEAQDGAVVLEMFKKQHHKIILSDLHMPIMNGEEAFSHIKKFCSENKWHMPRFVFISGYDADCRIKELVASDTEHCLLHKPVASKKLVEAIGARL